MNNFNTNLFCKEIGTDMFAGQFMGYWILVGENEKGSIYKKAFDKNREFSLYSMNIGCFRYSCAELDEFYPIEEEDIIFLNESFKTIPMIGLYYTTPHRHMLRTELRFWKPDFTKHREVVSCDPILIKPHLL